MMRRLDSDCGWWGWRRMVCGGDVVMNSLGCVNYCCLLSWHTYAHLPNENMTTVTTATEASITEMKFVLSKYMIN